MKILITLISLITVLAWANSDETVNPNDPNMAIGLTDGATTQADFNDPTRAHQGSVRSYGLNTTANCPECAKQSAQHEIPDDGVLTDSSGKAVKDGSGNEVRSTQ